MAEKCCSNKRSHLSVSAFKQGQGFYRGSRRKYDNSNWTWIKTQNVYFLGVCKSRKDCKRFREVKEKKKFLFRSYVARDGKSLTRCAHFFELKLEEGGRGARKFVLVDLNWNRLDEI